MYFKKLEMQGFKSFVDPTSLDLEKGITAVIGPNGCGKSNVVDSIRWVLGEQSAKSLRGTKMEDVIFNGTDQRKAVGMAEVSLTIDNSDHQLPSEHDEVTITRRTFRSGDSEYLINKAPCRLRDIQDLFLDTGIGRNAYSILEQGKIDLIVSSKASDRRFVFEEAAGISKYRSRKEESLRKLESTEQNFLRVNDIAVEVKRQIGSLERQVQKARRYQKLKQELTTLEVAQGRRELNDRRRSLRKVEHQWEEQRLTLEESEKFKGSFETELDELIRDLSGVETELGEMQSAVHHIQQEMIKAEDFISSSELRKQDLVISLERLESERKSLEDKTEQLTVQNSGALEVQEQKKIEVEEIKAALNNEEERLNALENELKERAARVQDRQSQLLQIVDQMSTLRGSLKSLEIRRSEREQQISKLSAQLESLQEQNRESFEEKAGFQKDQQTIRESIAALKSEGAALTAEKEKLENTIATLSTMIENFNKTMTQLTSRLTWIEELKNGLDGYELGAKSILLEHNSNPEKFPGIVGPLVNFVRTEQKYEFAFEALLGHQLQYILVEKEEHAKNALRFLSEDNRGRATFIPLSRYNADKDLHVPQSGDGQKDWLAIPGVLGWAKDLVRIDERFRIIFDELFSDVLVVETIEAGEHVRRSGATCTLVTLQGEIETSEGWITGGSQDVTERGLLGREREIEELKVELTVLEKNLAEALEQETSTKTKLEETLGGIEANNNEIHELDIKSAQVDKALENITAQLSEVEKQMNAVNQEKEAANSVLQETLSEHDKVAQALSGLELTDKQTQEELSQHQIEIEQRRQEYDERSTRAGELRVTVASIEEQLSSLQAQTERYQQQLSEIVSSKSEKAENITRDQLRLDELVQQVEEKQNVLVQLTETRSSQEESLEMLRIRRSELAAKRSEREAALKKVRFSLDSVHQTLHQLELQKSQLKMNLDSLEEYLVEEYKLNLAVEEAEDEASTLPEGMENPEEVQSRVKELKQKLGSMGSVNLVAMEEYDELQERYAFLSKQLEDLKEAKETLQRLISKINLESKARFQETFTQVKKEFKEVFRRLFNGGDADLILVDETNLLETGIDIIARPPGKRLQNISLLSGGEKALTAIALLFSIFLIKPSPFCIFDEMDAPLDDTNTSRFCRILREFAQKSQFIVITHNKITMETAQVLYGVTMQESGVSALISVKFKGDEAQSLDENSAEVAEKASLN